MKIISEISELPAEELALTTGFFDGVHNGHRYLIAHLQEIAQKEHLSSAILTFWPHPRTVLHEDYQPKLINTLDEKRMQLGKLTADYAILIPFTMELAKYSAWDFMKSFLKERLNVRHLVIGYDHRFGHNRENGFEDYEKYGNELGMDVTQAPTFKCDGKSISSSLIRRLIAAGNIKDANRYLGYNYSIQGEVVHGKHIGATIGFPTANLSVFDANKIIPSVGVYAVRIHNRGRILDGMACIGTRPTFEDEGQPTIEVNIFDLNENLYAEEMTVEFIAYVRPQSKFASKERLFDQLNKDRETVQAILRGKKIL